MKTFLINEQYKKTTKGGKWLCRVFMVRDDKQHIKHTWSHVVDITKAVAEKSYRMNEFDWINLTIHYWSWTGQMVISEIIKKYFYSDANIVDVSIF